MTAKQLKIKVKGTLRDLLAFKNLAKKRMQRFRKAPATRYSSLHVNDLAARLHPASQNLVIKEVRDETKSSRTFTLAADREAGTGEIAYFQAGQYLSIRETVEGCAITRPYSIASSPADALNGFYEITIRKTDKGFFTGHVWEHWKVGRKVVASAPMGQMFYSPLRDSRRIVAVAGGSGITPFRAMAREICAGGIDASLRLIYGCSDEGDIMFIDEFREMAKAHPDRFSFVLVMSCDEVTLEGCEKGFITGDIIARHSDPGSDSYFLCGPDLMYDFVTRELVSLGVPLRRLRREAYGEIKNPSRFTGYPSGAEGKTYSIVVHGRGKTETITARGDESVLVALERARYAPPSACRSGECQFCRTLLLKGDVWVGPESDGRREADRRNGYIHPCASFPVSDLELELPTAGTREG
ncbi:MAG: iron-sulfur cluster-binding domain-containing protein [Spirochaetes bacterium]|nr:iron-sulfur cluster-binding domain-containing protein [Spirochaetota bacterium]